MKDFRFVLTIGLLTVLSLQTSAQHEWKLNTNKDGIKVFTSLPENSPFKAVKTVGNVEATMSQLAMVLMDVSNTEDWVYGAKNPKLLKQFSPTDLIYYAEAALPWPMTNRDFIIRITMTQDPVTKVVTMSTENLPKYVPEKKGIVRIYRSTGIWKLTPVEKGVIRVEYTLQVDPGGSIPAWLVNLFATTGPYQSLKALRKEVKLAKYHNVKLPGISD